MKANQKLLYYIGIGFAWLTIGFIAFFVFLRGEFSSSKGLRAENPSDRRGSHIFKNEYHSMGEKEG